MKVFIRTLVIAFLVFVTPACIPQDYRTFFAPQKREASAERPASQLPPGFIAESSSWMSWKRAKDFCQQRGGRLPLINGLMQWDGSSIGTISIDGFGNKGTPWPSGLPDYYDDRGYWTGTENSSVSGHAWVVYPNTFHREITVDSSGKFAGARAICVP